jgi:glycyl-tRNA synthetase beta subunit
MAKKTKTVDFLLDIHTEPFPARFVPPALEQLKANAAKMLAGRIAHGEISVSGTLRHLVLSVKDVAAKGSDKTERFKGPKEGAPAPALEGFARKYGLPTSALKPEGGVLCRGPHEGRPPPPSQSFIPS